MAKHNGSALRLSAVPKTKPSIAPKRPQRVSRKAGMKAAPDDTPATIGGDDRRGLSAEPKNLLYYGDNLDVLRQVKDECVDLVYLDPPFNSSQDYNVLFAEQDGSRSKAQIKAFTDTWRWDQEAARSYQELVESGGALSRAMQAFHTFLGNTDMLAYLSMMAPRLVELRRVLKSTGSIYLHCDPTASHYLKMLMDSVFEAKNFRNEIVWCYRKWSVAQSQFSSNHDVILLYSRSANNIFNTLYAPVSVGTMKRWKGQKQRAVFDANGVRQATSEKGEEAKTPMGDWWEISIINPAAKERLGYPTQKPVALLERIIQASSNKGDVVLDPFCGCGTTIDAAQKLERHWIGIDITHLAITLIRHRLHSRFGNEALPKVIGEPVDISGAAQLAKEDPYQFQWWALGCVGARPVEPKKGADRGIDGRIYFLDDKCGDSKQIILSVKSGKLQPAYLRDLLGVINREGAAIGVLLCMMDPTKEMRVEAASAGFYNSIWGKHPRLQILTIADLLDGKGINKPPAAQVDTTFKKAPKVTKPQPIQPYLPL
jgi:site-specific DNA-methyltransferase (adenine-specific)